MAPSSLPLPLPLPRAIKRPVVLVIDRDHVARATRAYALTGLGFEVMLAADAAEARRRASAQRPDVILANIAASGGHDWELLGSLNADPGTNGIPVVAVTADAAPPVCARAEREGCAALCLPSCPPGELASGLRAVLNRRPSHA